MPLPLARPTILKKHTARFVRHHGDRFMRISWDRKPSWRRSRGIDSRVRRRFKSNNRTVKIGFGTNKAHRHILPNGFKKFLVETPRDLELLLLNNRVYAAQIAHNVAVPKRLAIIKRAAQLDVRVLNARARVATQDKQ
jgi:large subunit ribosomal protein L32e